MDGNIQSPPLNVALNYRIVGRTHVFASEGIRGLVHVGSSDREKAFDDIIHALNKHITNAYKCEAMYKSDVSYAEFSKHVEAEDDITGGFLTVTLDQASVTCQ